MHRNAHFPQVCPIVDCADDHQRALLEQASERAALLAECGRHLQHVVAGDCVNKLIRLRGAQVSLEAQRVLRRLRHTVGVKTLLIVASLRNWDTFVHTAGCDVYTAPVHVLRDWMRQDQIAPQQIMSRLDHSYGDGLGISARVLSLLGTERIANLYEVEASFIDFLQTFGSTQEWREMNDAETLFKRFEEAGYGDMFYSPRLDDWTEIRGGKVPDLNGSLTRRLPLDTLHSLLADADFKKHQAEMDGQILRHLYR